MAVDISPIFTQTIPTDMILHIKDLAFLYPEKVQGFRSLELQ